MNLHKSFLPSLLISFLLISPATSFAVESTKTTVNTNQSVLVSTVNIVDARVMSQSGNTVNVAFSISNSEGLQTGVRYGVQLVPDGAKYIADEKVYSESLTLYEHSIAKKEIAYVAPAQFGGSYNLILTAGNENNFPFAVVNLGKIKLTATSKSIAIDNSSCYLVVEGEKGSPRYTLTENVDISSSESLKLTCTATNTTDKTQVVTPFFETKYFNMFGKVAQQEGGDYTSISFNKGEKKTFSLALPTVDSPQFYNLKMSLMNADISSNNINLYYVLRGVSATIQKLSLDKDYYSFGDKGEMSIIWSASAGNFKRSNVKSNTPPALTLTAKITNKSGVGCTSPISQALVRDFKNPITKISFSARASCVNPHVLATISDANGNVLDEKEFTFISNADRESGPLSTRSMIIIVILLVVITILGITMRKKKNVTM